MIPIAICNQKGGVGKTTTTINLAAALAKLGKRVMAFDLDPQRNLSYTLGFEPDKQPTTANELIYFNCYGMPCDYTQFVRHNEKENVDFIPSTPALSSAPTVLASIQDGDQILKRALSNAFFEQYDIILLDCKPSLDLLTINALEASKGLVIPIEPEEYAVNGLADLLSTVKHRQKTNPALEITGVLMTRADSRRKSVQEVRNDLIGVLGEKVFDTTIPFLSEASDAAKGRQSCVNRHKSRVGELYMEVAKEVLTRLG